MRAALVVVSCAVAATLSACSPSESGTVGITRSGDELVAVIAPCGQTFDSAQLTKEPSGVDTESSEVIGDWERQGEAPSRQVLRWSLGSADPGEAIRARSTATLADLEADTPYQLYAWSTDVNVNIGGTYFTVADVEALRPGRILVPDRAELDSDVVYEEMPLVAVTPRRFREIACSSEYRNGEY